MIPREILKTIRQIELRTNRIVTGSVERGCPSRSASKTNPARNSIRPLKRRERRAPEQTLWTPQRIRPTFTP